MPESYGALLSIFFGFFAIMNPIANTAAFAALTGGQSRDEKKRTAAKALLITFIVILLFALLGKTIFHLFGISLPALKITGGIIVFVVGYHMLSGGPSGLHTTDNAENSDVAVSPLAVPLLAGPGTIATAMNYSASGGLQGISMTVGVFAVLCLITFICFVFSSGIVNKLGENGLGLVTRLMGLILAVMGTQMVISGASSALVEALG